MNESRLMDEPVVQQTYQGTSRRRLRIAIVALALALLAALLYGVNQYHRAESWRRTAYVQGKQLRGARDQAHAAQDQTQAALAETRDLRQKIKESVGSLDAPTFVTWNTPVTLRHGDHVVGTIPDTFTFQGHFTSTGSITLMIMSTEDFACWDTNACYAHWLYWGPSRHIDVVFHGAEGCADYVAVITGSGRVLPRVLAIRHPAHRATGVCRG